MAASSKLLKKLIPPALVLLAAAIVGLVALTPTPTPPVPVVEIPLVNVGVQVVHPVAQLADTFELTGVVEAERVVRVGAEVPGRIERIAERRQEATWGGTVLAAGKILEEGEPVTAGEPLVYLNAELFQARVQRAQAQFDFDEREYRRFLNMYERDSASQTEVDDARTRRNISKAALDESAEELERTTVLAPISGTLNRLPAEVGEYVAPGDMVAELVDLDPVKIAVDLPEREVGWFRTGAAVEVLARIPEELRLTGPITYISALADPATRTSRVEVTLANPDGRLRSGQIVQVRLARRTLTDVIMVPLAAVIPLEQGRMVYVVEGERAVRRDVELGFIRGRSVQVVSGLEAGARLIVEGHRYVGPDQPVKIVREE